MPGRVAAWAVACLVVLSPAVHASDKVYKSVGPDGKVVYSQTPPAEGRLDKQMQFEQLPTTPLPDYVLKFRADMERNIALKQLPAADAPQKLTLFNARWCGYCRQAQGWLAAQGITYVSMDIDTPDGMAAFVRARAGKGGVPLLLGPGVRVQGYSAQAYQAALAKRQP